MSPGESGKTKVTFVTRVDMKGDLPRALVSTFTGLYMSNMVSIWRQKLIVFQNSLKKNFFAVRTMVAGECASDLEVAFKAAGVEA